MGRLHETLAVEPAVKGQATAFLATAHHTVTKPALLAGLSRTYQPRDEDGDQLPPESTRVQVRADTVLRNVAAELTRWFDVTATKEVANQHATANVVVDGAILIPDAPVTLLLFLEKRLVDLRTFMAKLPILDPAEAWTYSDVADCWVTEPVKTVRARKIPRNHVLAPADGTHAAQVQVYHEDVAAGDWTLVKFSGALPAARVAELVARVDRLAEAVKVARVTANTADTVPQRVGEALFGYLLR